MNNKIDSMVTRLKSQLGLQRYNFLRELTRPARTSNVRLEESLRTTEGGIFRGRVVEPLESELAMIEFVGEISGVVSNNSLAHNLRVLQARIDLDTQELGATLSNIGTKVSPQDSTVILDAVAKEIDDSIWVIQSEKQAMKSVKKAGKLVKKSSNTTFGILCARIEFEQWLEHQRPTFFLDQEREPYDEDDAVVFIDKRTYSADDRVLSISAKLVCAALNDLILAKMPHAESAEPLRKRPILINAVENIRPKVNVKREKLNRKTWF